MKALSIRQPWAWLICKGYKDVENRDWPLPRDFSLPQRIYVHAGKIQDDDVWEDYEHLILTNTLTRGAIIGEVTITKILIKRQNGGYGQSMGDIQAELEYLKKEVPEYFSPWFIGEYGFILKDPVLYNKTIPYRGQLGFFEVKLP